MKHKLKAYRFRIILLAAIIIGMIIGLIFGEKADVIKPLGDIFINLLFVVVVPLVFFSISSAIANMDNMKRLGKIFGSMITVFVVTGIIASVFMLIALLPFLPITTASISVETPEVEVITFAEQLVQTFTVSDFVDLFSRENMLALIVMAVLVGTATGLIGEKGKPFARLLSSASEVFMKVVQFIMYYA